MDMSGMDMVGGMGDMDMGSGVPDLFYLQKTFWAVIGAAIACAAVVHFLDFVLCWQRYALLHTKLRHKLILIKGFWRPSEAPRLQQSRVRCSS